MSHDYVRRTGRPYGYKPVHLVYGVVLAVVWVAIIVFVLTHGANQQSSVDVYSELPPGFTSQLQQQGVQYQGLSSVDPTTQHQVLAHLPATAGSALGSQPLVFRTSFSVTKGTQPGVSTPAIMVVVPSSQGAMSGTVDFVDPTTYRELKTLSYGGGASPSP